MKNKVDYWIINFQVLGYSGPVATMGDSGCQPATENNIGGSSPLNFVSGEQRE